jgi:hypothetical protein
VAVALAAALYPTPAAAQPLAVPFLPQSEDLCGGAAAAMVMRYWGAADVYPDAFARLVDHSAGGIRTGTLTADLERRGWVAAAGSGSAAELDKELQRGRPIMALIEDRPGRFHYVVILARTDRGVTLHDPARGPSREMPLARFDAAWRKSDRWMMILLPPPAPVAPAPNASSPNTADRAVPETAATACQRLVDNAVAQAETDREGARAALRQATRQCASEAAPWRELAGLDALEQHWSAAAANARHAVELDAADAYAWRILATASYLQHDDRAALAAWNQIGEPVVNLIDIQGLHETRYDVVADAIGVQLEGVLTPGVMERAERRVREVPSISAARVAYQPIENGRVRINATIVERERVPRGVGALVRLGLDAAVDREVSATLGSVTGGGDIAGATWRWWAHRPMVSAFYAAPAPRALGGGVWRVDLARETQTFGTAAFEETRTRAAMSLANWISGRTRVSAGAALERWNLRADDVAFSGGVEHWRAGSRVRMAAEASAAAGRDAFSAAKISVAARSSAMTSGLVLGGVAGIAAASQSSPATLWPGADTGHARDVLLRAHPLLDDGIITGGAFGRRLAFASFEAQYWTPLRRLPVRWAPAAFVDAARAARGLPSTDERLLVDAGAGLRLAIPGAAALRVDVAHGLRGGGWVLSAGWDRRWR